MLGLMQSPEPVVIGEHSYLGLLALIYVPSAWVRPAEGGVERLMNVYVSMGATPPLSLPRGAKRALAKPAKKPSS